MRKVLLTLALLGMAAGAWATPDDLTGGVFVAHTVDQLVYTSTPPAGGWCGTYAGYAISDLSQVDVTLPFYAAGSLWYVLAAWENESKTWCGTEFGLGDYDAAIYSEFYEAAPCFPVAGLEIPTPGWPGPNEGTAFVTTGTPWAGNWVPVYYFAGYSYEASYGATIMHITVDPPTGFCGLSNCQNPPLSFTVGVDQRGAMGVNMMGEVPVFSVVEPGACCIPVEPFCLDLVEQECIAMGGVWHGGETCATYPCPVTAACCIGGLCQMLFEENCILLGGTWLPGVTCEPNPCPAVCCFQMPTNPHGCEIMLEADCATAGGFWHPEWVSCEPNPCEIYTPAENASWGTIKNMYR